MDICALCACLYAQEGTGAPGTVVTRDDSCHMGAGN